MPASLGECETSGPVGAWVAAALQFFAASQCLLQQPYPKQADVSNGSRFDFIIVGAGTAGCALAARLAAVPQFRVLLVEAGGDPPQESIVPAFVHELKSSPYDWNFTTLNDGYSSQALEGHRMQQPRGKMLGGTGSMNDMVYSRGHPSDYDGWATIVGDTWNWTNVLPYFMRTERLTDEKIVNNSELMQFHGRDGEIEVSGRTQINYDTTKLLEAFEEIGFNIVDDMTYPYKIGAGRFSHTVRDGRRDSSLTALLNKVHSDNLHVLKDTLVAQILTQNNRAVGVKALSSDGEELYFYAEREVIVSAGTLNTPKLLLLSGVGPKNYLENFGIDVLQDLPVGNNLHDHVMVLYFIATENGTCTPNESGDYFDMIKYLYDGSGLFSYSDSMGVYLPNNNDDLNVPYFAIYPSCNTQASIDKESCINSLGYTEAVCTKLSEENEQHEIISVAVVLLKPQSRGTVRLVSTNPFDDPLIYSGTFGNMVDYEMYPEAVQVALSIVNTKYFKEKKARVIDLNPDICKGLDDAELINCQVREFAMPAWHAVGTAAMGTVVDAELRVHGLEGLRVVDASVMPTIIRGNTNAPVIMIAEKAADFIIKNSVDGN